MFVAKINQTKNVPLRYIRTQMKKKMLFGLGGTWWDLPFFRIWIAAPSSLSFMPHHHHDGYYYFTQKN